MRKHLRRVAIGIDLEWPFKHHVGVVSGIMEYARERGWDCVLAPFPGGTFDGLIGRVTREMAAFVRRARIPAVNVWVDSPDTALPRVVPDQKAAAAPQQKLPPFEQRLPAHIAPYNTPRRDSPRP